MTFLIVSDTHGRFERLKELCEKRKRVDALIFLGDGLSDIDYAKVKNFGFTVIAVKGNWDTGRGGITAMTAQDELAFTFEGVRFYAMHGHTRGVKGGLTNAIYAAEAAGADVLLYGHTHEPFYTYLEKGEYNLSKPMHIFNPGSLANYNYGICIVENGMIMLDNEIL